MIIFNDKQHNLSYYIRMDQISKCLTSPYTETNDSVNKYVIEITLNTSLRETFLVSKEEFNKFTHYYRYKSSSFIEIYLL